MSIRKTIFVGILRLCTGVAQFAVVLFMTRAFSLVEVGQYSLFIIVLGYFSQIAGLSFHTYMLREMAGEHKEHWPVFLGQLWCFLGISIVGAGVIFLVLLESGLVQIHGVSNFLLLLALVTINLQHENVLVGAGHPVFASICLLLRSIWILPLAVIYALDQSPIDISWVYVAWVVSEGFAALFALFVISRQNLWPRFSRIDLAWIVRGANVGLRFTFLSLVLLLTVSVQRVILSHTHGDEAVGVFHFFFVISVFLPNLIEATLYAIHLPRLIAQHKALNGEFLGAPSPELLILWQGAAAIGLTTIWLLFPLLVSLLGRLELLEYKPMFLATAAYALMYSASRAFHYQLYASGRDALLTRANLIACAGACLAAILLIPAYGLYGAGIAILLAGFVMVLAFGWPFIKNIYA